MSDLQCPVRLLLAGTDTADDPVTVPPGLTGGGALDRLAARAADCRVAGIYSGLDSAAGERVGGLLGMRPGRLAGLGGPAEEHPERLQGNGPADQTADADGAIRRFADAVDEIADMHRGEAVLVFAPATLIGAAVRRLTLVMPPGPLPPGEAAEVDVDADGWRLRRWPAPRVEPVRSGPTPR